MISIENATNYLPDLLFFHPRRESAAPGPVNFLNHPHYLLLSALPLPAHGYFWNRSHFCPE